MIRRRDEGSPSDDRNLDFELVVDYVDETLADTTVHPPSPERIKQREADRESIELFVALAKREQERENARRKAGSQGAEDIEMEADGN